MSELTEGELHTRWRDRWDGFLDDLNEATTPAAAQTELRDKRTIGNAERKIAGGHEGREILELLQNARDAIWNGDSDDGRVHISIYDEGVLVANTGSRFDLFDSQVEDAVTMIGETGKGDEDDQSIGHKGVGLKSILATGDAFEIFTRPNEATDELLGVRLSRAYLVGGLLRRLGHEVDLSDQLSELNDPELKTLLQTQSREDPIPITEDLATAISQLPLFNFPVPLRTDDGAGDSVRRRVRELLTGATTGQEEEPYRTAVFVRYEDTDWRNLLSAFDIATPNEDERSVADRPERIWEYLSAGATDGGLQPETLVQLGGISELQLERVTDQTDQVKSEQWEITRTPTPSVRTAGLAHEAVDVAITTDESPSFSHQFDQFRFEEPREYHTTLLVNKSDDGNQPFRATYPLYLFYPIESTSGANLPFCLHGRFRVETNRKDLSSNKSETNRQVLAEGIDLIELVGREAAMADGDPDAPTYSRQLPWALLPPLPDDEPPSNPSSSDELSDWFQANLLDRLAETECVPTDDGPAVPAETLLHWDDVVLGGYVAFRNLLTELGRTQSQPSSRPLPTKTAIEAAIDTPRDWSPRLQHLVQVDDRPTGSRMLLDDWVETLNASLSMGETESPSKIVAAPSARALLRGTVSLLTASTTDDEPVSNPLDDLADQFDGVYLLPCEIRDEDPDEHLALVTLEQRLSPGGGQTTQRQARSVIWDVESDTRDVDRPPIPPQESNMAVYFLDSVVQRDSEVPVHQVLSSAGRVWGIREYEGIPSFVRSLLDTFADGRHDVVEPSDFTFLAAIISRVGEDSRDLGTGEGEFFPLSYLRSAITQQEGDQRGNLRRRVELRECDLQLGSRKRPISETVIGDGWQEVRARQQFDEEDGDPTEDWNSLRPDAYSAPLWPEPDEFNWTDEQKRRSREGNIVRTLGLLGTGAVPGIRVVWMYGDDHPAMQQRPNWDPTEWDADSYPAEIPDSIRELQAVVRTESEYLDQITSPDYHPQVSADHSPKCSVKTDGSLYKVNLASWAWIEDTAQVERHGEAVRELLRRHGTALDSTLLRTGWSCNNGHKRRDWERTVPSLLNWQLRTLDIWEPIVELEPEMTENWDGQGSRLRYAVKLESQRGPQAARMFPYVTGETAFTDDLLETLGVRSVENLGMTGATERLQQLQTSLVDGTLPDNGTARLWIPGERLNDWNQAYTQLLQPVLRHLPETPESTADDLDWGALTHLPLRDGDDWVAAPIEWITNHTDEIRYYQDQSPKPWETQAVEEAGHYILPRTAGGPFTRLSNTLEIPQVDASKLVFEYDDESLEFVTDQYSDTVSKFRRALSERRDLLVASTERTDEDEVLSTAADLATAADQLAVVDSFPESALKQLSDPSSALYRTEAGNEALLLNADEAGEDITLEALSMGVALLFERPTKVATFREALGETSVEVLEPRWEKRTFPIEAIKRILGSNAHQAIERDITALADLLERLGRPTPAMETGLAALEDADRGTIVAIREWLADAPAEDATPLTPPDLSSAPEVESLVTDLLDELPPDLMFVAAGLFGQSVTHWIRDLETHSLDESTHQTLIGWLHDHRAALERPPFDEAARQAYSRFQTVVEFRAKTNDSELAGIDTWVDGLRQLHSSEVPAWDDPLPPAHARPVDCPPFVAHLAIENRVATLVRDFCDDLDVVLADADFDWRSLVQTYVTGGTLPDLETGAGAKDHQEQAFTDLAKTVRSGESATGGVSASFGTDAGQTGIERSTISASEGSGQGGGSTQFRGRGQQAEAYVMAGVLDRVADLLEDEETVIDIQQFRTQFKQLHSKQQEAEYNWHVQTAWDSELLPLLRDRNRMTSETITDWRALVADETNFTDLPLIQLINVTMEQGPGFDIIDPLGPLPTDQGQDDSESDQGQDDIGLWFTPVEVKAVNGATGPFGFRLTINEYRQAKAFVRGGIPYVIRLVSVPEPGTLNWPEETEVVAEKILRTEDELEAIIGSHRFENVIKGGYMNMRIE